MTLHLNSAALAAFAALAFLAAAVIAVGPHGFGARVDFAMPIDKTAR